ncbi:MAG: PilZ domain-containing protein [Terriglobales bacterium]
MADTRTGKRFPLTLATTIRGGKKIAKKGTTSDLSSAGVFILADADFEVGTKVEFDITLPAAMIGANKDVEVRCQGRVVRANEDTGSKKKKPAKGGLACVIDNYEFIRKR